VGGGALDNSTQMISRLALLLVASLSSAALVARPLSSFPGAPRAAASSAADGDSRPLNVRPARRPATVLMADAAVAEDGSETFEFEAEVAKVMDIIINSLYSDKDIFLRELISNASDACDKKRFLSLTEDGGSAYEGRIRVVADKETNTLTIEDNGIGLTRKEMRENLGRIAQSGTKKFTEALGSGGDATNLIGQFGVGFYSAFLVADKVTVVSKSADGEQLKWESAAASAYTISQDDSTPIEGTGTRLTLHLKARDVVERQPRHNGRHAPHAAPQHATHAAAHRAAAAARPQPPRSPAPAPRLRL